MIIAIGAHTQVGKDLSTHMLHHIDKCHTSGIKFPDMWQLYEKYDVDWSSVSNFRTKKFADKVKDIVCIITGCHKKQLEDNDFKNSYLPDEFNYYENHFPCGCDYTMEVWDVDGKCSNCDTPVLKILKKYTYRESLQRIGTNLLRFGFHKNVWVNALFSEYKPIGEDQLYPNWIINDVRFPNEALAIKEKGGILIRLDRDTDVSSVIKLHPSETALDDYNDWDYIIDNNGTKEELFNKLIEIYKNEEHKIIKRG